MQFNEMSRPLLPCWTFTWPCSKNSMCNYIVCVSVCINRHTCLLQVQSHYFVMDIVSVGYLTPLVKGNHVSPRQVIFIVCVRIVYCCVSCMCIVFNLAFSIAFVVACQLLCAGCTWECARYYGSSTAVRQIFCQFILCFLYLYVGHFWLMFVLLVCWFIVFLFYFFHNFVCFLCFLTRSIESDS